MPLYRPPLDFNALPVPPHYVPGSLRNDRGFRTSAEKIVSTPISFCESELKTLRELSLLHAPLRSATEDPQGKEQTSHVKEPKRKHRGKKHQIMMPSVYDVSHTQRFEALSNRDAYRCYTVASGDPVTHIYSSQESTYAKKVADLELECHRNPTAVSLWLRLISVHYNIGNMKLAASTALAMFNNMDYSCNYQKLWDLLLSDDSVTMKALLEQCDLSSIHSLFQLVVSNLNACIPSHDNEHLKEHIRALIDCKHMVLCANLFCILFLSSEAEPNGMQLLCSVYNNLVDSLIRYHTYNFSYYIAVVEILYLRIHGSTTHNSKTINPESYDDLVKHIYGVETIIAEDARSNALVGAYFLTESIILQDSLGIVLIVQHASSGAFRCSTIASPHSKQLERLVCGIGSFSSPIISTNTVENTSIDKSLLLLQNLIHGDSDVHSLIKNLTSRGVGTPDLASINRALERVPTIPDDELLIIFHVGRRACLSVLADLDVEKGKGTDTNSLMELLTCIENINKINTAPEIFDYLVENGLKMYRHLVLQSRAKDLDRLEIGLLILSMCKSTELAEDLFRTYKRAIRRAQDRHGPQGRLNTLPRVENMILYAQDDAAKEAIVDCANGPGSLYQGALKEAILTKSRHMFPYTEKFMDKLLITAEASQWLKHKISALLQGAKYLLTDSGDKLGTEIAAYLHTYAASASCMCANSTHLDYIIETLEILMLSRTEGVKRLKKCSEDYIETLWAGALMSVFICEQDKEKATLYWKGWTEGLQRNQHDKGPDSPVKSAFDSIVLECTSLLSDPKLLMNRGKTTQCLLKTISVVLFYSCQLD